ncbi:MAG TPA: hypothetical protein VIT44_17505 [Cyclobacteriaceae bacterium]
METIPTFVIILFVAATIFTVWQFYSASGKSKTLLIGIGIWMLLQTVLGLAGFYKNNESIPPRFVLLIGPAIIFIAVLFLTQRGKKFIDALDLGKLTFLHTVRVPVEITLYFVCAAGLIPVLMTFEGNNYDILSGLTAPAIFYLVFKNKKASKSTLLIWNFLCLGLLINVLTIAILAAQTPFQRLAFDQPNIGVTFFPFVWLPSVIVPIVLFSHLAAIRQLLSSSAKK